MITERQWLAISARPFTANGGQYGQVQLDSTLDFRVKQKVQIRATAQLILTVEVKRVISINVLEVGPIGQGITSRSDLTLYTTAASATIEASEQPRPSISLIEFQRASFEEEPISAIRSFLVDKLGNGFDSVVGIDGKTRLMVDAAVSVSGVTVDLDAFTKNPPDNAIAVGTEDGSKNGVKHALKVGSDLKLEVKDTAADASLASIDGKITTTVNGIKVDGSAVTQPVSASSLPLPTGAATAAKQDTGNASLASIDGKIPASPSQEHVTAASPHAARLSDGTAFYKATTPADTQPVSAVSLPLPTGAATAANQATANASLASIDSKLTSPVAVTGPLTDVQLRATKVPVKIDAFTGDNAAIGQTWKKNIDQASATVTYIGYADPGVLVSAALWQIRRITVTGSVTAIEWADSDKNFDNIWNNRAALVYG